jgi:uncharacterized protein
MNKKITILLLVLFFAVVPVFALDKLTSYVNDEADVISPEYEQRIYNELEELDKNTSIEMAVATVKNLNGVPIEEYSINLAHNTLGEKGKDNGLLLLLAIEDREYRIEIGYGLEPLITDAMSGRIGRDVMAPYFKAGNYEEGLLQGVLEIKKILKKQNEFTNESKVNTIMPIVILIIIIIIFAVMIAVSLIRKQKAETNKDFKAVENAGAIFGPGLFGPRGGFGGGIGGFGGSSGGFGGFGGGGFGGGGSSGGF